MCVCVFWHTFVKNQVFRRVCTAVVTIDLSFACMHSNSQPHNECYVRSRNYKVDYTSIVLVFSRRLEVMNRSVVTEQSRIFSLV